MNCTFENYLRFHCSYHQDAFGELFPAELFACKSAVTEDLDMSPFEIFIGWNPKCVLGFIARGESAVKICDDLEKDLREFE